MTIMEQFEAHGIDLHRSVLRKGQAAEACPLFRFLDEWFPYRRNLRLLEIGTCRGVSTALLATRGTVVTLDLNAKPEVPDTLDALGVRDRVTCLTGNPVEARRKVEGRFDAVFIDGEHSREAVLMDFRFAAMHTNRFIFHDYMPKFRGVQEAIDYVIAKYARAHSFINIFAGVETYE